MEPFVGEIKLVGFNFAPRGWLPCNGQLLPIAQNTALFSLLGTTYGGNGQTTFALPDLRGRVPVGIGQGPGLSGVEQGQMGGVENVTLLNSQMPMHTHIMTVSNANADTFVPANGAILAVTNDAAREPVQQATYLAAGSPNVALNPSSLQPQGGSQPHENRQPFLGSMYIIATEGIYPSRP